MNLKLISELRKVLKDVIKVLLPIFSLILQPFKIWAKCIQISLMFKLLTFLKQHGSQFRGRAQKCFSSWANRTVDRSFWFQCSLEVSATLRESMLAYISAKFKDDKNVFVLLSFNFLPLQGDYHLYSCSIIYGSVI